MVPVALAVTPRNDRVPMARVVLISPYELGRQPFALAEAAAWLSRAGFSVVCLDLAQQRLDPAVLRDASTVMIHLAMHTATRIAVAAIPRIRALEPRARVVAFGLYAPVNEGLLHSLGVDAAFGGESEPDLVDFATAVRDGNAPAATGRINRSRIDFLAPERNGLPALGRYAKLVMPDGSARMSAFTETTRGCKHLCRHCPVVPVYQGRFRVVPVAVVLADIAQQVEAGATHVSFGDPDFFNGPTHAMRIVDAMHARFPALSFDATIKVSHLRDHGALLPRLRDTGCAFVTTAVESFEDAVLARLDKGHTRADFEHVLAACRSAGIPLAATFVPFTPWTTLDGFRALLRGLLDLGLVNAVPPVQIALRLLIPAGSRLLDLEELRTAPFDAGRLGHVWTHADAQVDGLQATVMEIAMAAGDAPRGEVFARIWEAAHAAAGLVAPRLRAVDFGPAVPHLSEAWYCCAEPTDTQLASF